MGLHRVAKSADAVAPREDDVQAPERYDNGKSRKPRARGVYRWLWWFIGFNLVGLLVFIFMGSSYAPAATPGRALASRLTSELGRVQLLKKEPMQPENGGDSADDIATPSGVVAATASESPERPMLRKETPEAQQTHSPVDSSTAAPHAGAAAGADNGADDGAGGGAEAGGAGAGAETGEITDTQAEPNQRPQSPQPTDLPPTILPSIPTLPPNVAGMVQALDNERQTTDDKQLESDEQHPNHANNQAHLESAVSGLDVVDNMVLWLRADAHVELKDPVDCHLSQEYPESCLVTGWSSRAVGRPLMLFRPLSKKPELHLNMFNGLPAVSMACPMINTEMLLHDSMTLFFVLAPRELQTSRLGHGGVKFFGNSPYGHFLFHGNRPSFFTTGGLVQASDEVHANELALVTYRLHRGQVEIKVNAGRWSQSVADTVAVHFSRNIAMSLGNAKDSCDSSAFRGFFSEMLVYDSLLSDVQVSLVETYLIQRWWGADGIDHADPEAADTAEEADPLSPLPSSSPQHPDHPLGDPAGASTAPNVPTQTTADILATDATSAPAADTGTPTADAPGDDGSPQQQAQDDDPFGPENVFEWTPSERFFNTDTKRQNAEALKMQWQKAVHERVESIRAFQLGGDELHAYIRARKDELMTLRHQLFG